MFCKRFGGRSDFSATELTQYAATHEAHQPSSWKIGWIPSQLDMHGSIKKNINEDCYRLGVASTLITNLLKESLIFDVV